MRSVYFLFILSVALLGCNTTPPSDPISQGTSETAVVLQSETDNHEVIQEFDLNNCDGKADATRTEHRSSSIDVTISAELAATIGASAQVISAEVQAAVGTALRIGGDRGTSIELKAPPNTHMFFQLAWVGKSRIGVVQNVSGSNIPVAFQSFTPDNVRIKSQYDIGCHVTPAPVTQPAETQSPIVPEPTRKNQSPPSFTPVAPAATLGASGCDGYNWETCWVYDHSKRTMNWVGREEGPSDIGQDGEALSYIRSGYTAIFTISTEMKIYICVGQVNGESIGTCPQTLNIAPGTYTVSGSTGESGGFRVYP